MLTGIQFNSDLTIEMWTFAIIETVIFLWNRCFEQENVLHRQWVFSSSENAGSMVFVCCFLGVGGRGEEIWAFVHTGVKNPSYWRQVVAKQKMRNKEKIVGGQIFISYFKGRQLEFESAHVMLDSATSAFFSLHFIWWSMCILKENPTRFINANISSKKVQLKLNFILHSITYIENIQRALHKNLQINIMNYCLKFVAKFLFWSAFCL